MLDEPDEFLINPVDEVNRCLAENNVLFHESGMCPDVVMAIPAVFNFLTAATRRWGLQVDIVPVVWEPGANSGVVRAARISSEGRSFLAYRTLTSSPMAANQFERLIAAGGKRFLYAGYADPISDDASVCDIVLASSAVRDDGVSRHYAEESERIDAGSELLENAVHAADELGVPVRVAPVWTIDALFRRSRNRALQLASDGVAAVETVVSALYAIGAFRRVPVAAVLAIENGVTESVDSATQEICRVILQMFLS